MSNRHRVLRHWLRRWISVWLVGCALASGALAKTAPEYPRIATHDNLEAAGKLEGGVLTLRLEIREGDWRPDADDGPSMPMLAFAEEGKNPSIPGPMIRVPQGTTVHVSIKNEVVFTTVFVHGLHQRPGKAEDALKIPFGETKEVTFLAGESGTYYYWAATGTDLPIEQRVPWDTQLAGAFVVDPPGGSGNDRVMVIGVWYAWLAPMDLERGFRELPTVNGKSWPNTTRLSYNMGETIRWRVINASGAVHPMHLHGTYFQVESEGDAEHETRYPPEQQRSVVTQLMTEGRTMNVSWTPGHAGNWIFHCHLASHIDSKIARHVSEVTGVPSEKQEHHDMGMAGLVVGISVKPVAVSEPVAVRAVTPARKLTLAVSRNAETGGQNLRRTIRIEVTDEHGTASTPAGSELGPPIILHRGETTEITVQNRLETPTALHWHGMEIESYYDGVVGLGGDMRQVTPAIDPGGAFVARMTPPRAGTFIYHTHWHDLDQLTTGLYGALIVLGPGEKYDPEHDRVFLVSRSGSDILYAPMLVNGTEHPGPSELQAGEKYRIRLINITPSDDSTGVTLVQDGKAVSWTPLAKDGADLPAYFRKSCEAKLVFAAGETYDFELLPGSAGKLELQTTFAELKTTVPIAVVDAKTATVSRR
jgi:FtsP/CotA-like multicopper oxidase with cupredoxin domain